MFIINPRLASDIFDNEYIIANLDTGLYYSVQGSAVSLIQALPFADADLVIRQFGAAFPEQAETIQVELKAIFDQLVKEEIIKHKESAAGIEGSELALPAVYAPSRFNRYADMQDLLMLDPIHDVDEEGWPVKQDQ